MVDALSDTDFPNRVITPPEIQWRCHETSHRCQVPENYIANWSGYFKEMLWTEEWRKLIRDIYDMIYLLTAVGLSPGGSTHLQTNNT
jgi:hypothetical protein